MLEAYSALLTTQCQGCSARSTTALFHELLHFVTVRQACLGDGSLGFWNRGK